MIRNYFINTSCSRFRSESDIEPIGLLTHLCLSISHQNQILGEQTKQKVSSAYFEFTDHTNFSELKQKLRTKKAICFCINDVMKHPSQDHLKKCELFMKTGLPHHHSK